jgi:hypothetical protein
VQSSCARLPGTCRQLSHTHTAPSTELQSPSIAMGNAKANSYHLISSHLIALHLIACHITSHLISSHLITIYRYLKPDGGSETFRYADASSLDHPVTRRMQGPGCGTCSHGSGPGGHGKDTRQPAELPTACMSDDDGFTGPSELRASPGGAALSRGSSEGARVKRLRT